ncbi:hypothetical protein GGQ91_002557 [Methylobacterium fujisawaense]|uniref:Uncharacterized protein n=1 Tax=Methylobacterium fujisawaense TaxID=107400 RepID=A0ABR6DAQ3_9HYPH|nr:hypothetical protein [Methylobacterium fujisawaense]MBA9063169.1 hypothetical protein [Methylobacterium fujisawaense]
MDSGSSNLATAIGSPPAICSAFSQRSQQLRVADQRLALAKSPLRIFRAAIFIYLTEIRKGTNVAKNSNNELRKIRATFWNNLAVASVVAGAIGPYLKFYVGIGSYVKEYRAGTLFVYDNMASLAASLGAFVLSMYAAKLFRNWAEIQTSLISDD